MSLRLTIFAARRRKLQQFPSFDVAHRKQNRNKEVKTNIDFVAKKYNTYSTEFTHGYKQP